MIEDKGFTSFPRLVDGLGLSAIYWGKGESGEGRRENRRRENRGMGESELKGIDLMQNGNIIGIIGGMGPHAGLDLMEKILDHTLGKADQDHLPIALLSYPGRIPDRARFLFGQASENPADAITQILFQLDDLGARIAGIPCNTAHVPAIFDPVRERLSASGRPIKLLHIVEETLTYLRTTYPKIHSVGVLSTLAVFRLGLYRDALTAAGFEAVAPDETVQEYIVNRTIYDPTYGVKAHPHPVSKIARQSLLTAVAHLREKGAKAIILGCTELPLALTEPEINGLPIIDPTAALARALIRAATPDRLKPI